MSERSDGPKDSIMLRFELMKEGNDKFKFSSYKNVKEENSFSTVYRYFYLGHLLTLKILNKKLIIFFSEKNVQNIDIKEILGQDKIYITMVSSLPQKLILNDFKVKILSENPEENVIYPPSENGQDHPTLQGFPKLRKLSGSKNYINIWISGEQNKKVNFLSDSFTSDPTEIYEVQSNKEKKLNSKIYTIYQSNKPIQIKLVWDKNINECENMFKGCTNIISVDLSNSNIKCKKMNSMFEGCTKLKKVILKNVQTSNVEDMSSMFSGCVQLKHLNSSSFDTSKVLSMESMFKNCRGLKYLDLSNFKTPQITNVKSMFENCKNLQYVNMENFLTEKCKEDDAFKECRNLKKINLLNYKGKDIFTSISRNKNLEICINDYSQISTKKNTLMKNNIPIKCRNKATKKKRTLDSVSNTIKVKIKGEKNKSYLFLSYSFSNLPDKLLINGVEVEEISKSIVFSEDGEIEIAMTWNQKLEDCQNMFMGCDSIVSVDLSDFDSSLISNTKTMFSGCSSLKSIKFGNFDTSKVKNMQGMFTFCKSLTSIDLSSFKTSLVEEMSFMFSDCTELKYLDLSNFDTLNVKNMGSMFLNCKSLTSLKINNSETKSTDRMPSEFKELKNLDNTNYSTFTTLNVQYMDSMFNGCSKLISLDLSKFKMPNIINMNSMFYNCSSLIRIDLPYFDDENLDTTKIDVDTIFKNCDNLRYLNILNYKSLDIFNSISQKSDLTVCVNDYSQLSAENSLKIHNRPNICCRKNSKYVINANKCVGELNLITIYVNGVKGEEINIINSEFNTLPDYVYINDDYNDLNLVSSIKLPKDGENVVRLIWIGSVKSCNAMFQGCNKIKSIDLSSFNSLSIESSNSMFSGCSSLESINFKNFKTSGIKDMSGMFSGCQSLESIDLSGFTTPLVEDMSYMFSDCIKLKSIDLSTFDTSNVKDMSSMFSECDSLSTIEIDNFDTQSLVKMSSMFSDCSNLNNLDLLNLNTINVEFMDSMFSGCSKLESLDISNFDTPNLKTMNSMFNDCISLITIDMRNISTLQMDEAFDSKSIFANCNSMKYLDLRNYVNKDIFDSISENQDLSICINDYSQISDGKNI